MRYSLFAAAALVAATSAVSAQSLSKPIPEFRPLAGAYVPTGPQRDLLKDAPLVGAQLALEVLPYAHLVGTFAWTGSESRLLTTANAVNLYQYNIGTELFATKTLSEKWQLRPFFGLGAGGMTYDPQLTGVDTKTYFAAYAALGTEFQIARLALRFEGRDNLSEFKGLGGGEDSSWRNDLMLALGVAYHFR